jgi:hypothetical protein
MRIEVSAEDLYSRGNAILRLLHPLARSPKKLFVQYLQVQREIVIAVSPQNGVGLGSYADYRFATTADGFWAMYHERWSRSSVNKEQRHYLYRAYLHIYHVDQALGKEDEFVLLHCDPK